MADVDYDDPEARELARLRNVATLAIEAAADFAAALNRAAAAKTVEHAAAHLRGAGRTFALACLKIVELA
jgi:hypothetical protein